MKRFTFFAFRLIDLDRRSLFHIRFLEFTSSDSEAETKQELESLKEILVKQAEAASSLRTLNDRLAKVAGRVNADETELAALRNGDITPELEQAVTALNTQVDVLDPQTPAPTPTPVPVPDPAPAATPAQ